MTLPVAAPNFDVQLIAVTKQFGTYTAVKGVSLQVRRGEFFSLLGPSGCGKSTTLRMIAGFEHPDSGEVHIAGRNVSGVPAYRRETNMVFQRLALFPHMSIAENVAFGLTVKRVGRSEVQQRVAEALDMVQLGHVAGRFPGQLSGGQQQRVALARALVNRPRVLLLDEPLGALDAKLRLQMQLELKRIQREVGTTFIFVTHDQSEAMTMSDQIAVMDHGVVAQVGTPQQIYDQPRTRYVANFIGDANMLEATVRSAGPDGVVLDAAGLVVAAGPVPGLNTGAGVGLSIRHERVRVAKDLPPMPNRFSGTVSDVIFTGSAVKYTVALVAGRLNITAQQAHDGVTPLLPPGTAVQVGWNPDAGVVLQA